jgi:hypothetical protein
VIRMIAVSILLSFLVGLQLWPERAAAQTPDLARLYRQFIEAINRGDVNAAVALMTDDAQLQGTPGCLMSACRGKAAVRQDLEQDAAAHLQIQFLGTIQVSGSTVKANTAHRADLLRGTGISRVIINETATFQGDKISRFVLEPETADPQTATLVRLLTSGAPPVVPASAADQTPAVRPPSTGDGGLLQPSFGAEEEVTNPKKG